MYKKEIINVKHAKYLLSIPDDKLTNIITKNKDGEFKEILKCEVFGFKNDIETYKKKLKKFLKKAIIEMESKGYVLCEYKYSKRLVSFGRRYVVGFGLQTCKKEIKGFLCSGIYHDIDIVNCAPSILLNLVEKHYPEFEAKYLKRYVEHREKYLQIEGVDKQTIISSMYYNKKLSLQDQKIIKLDLEIKKIQNMFFKNYHEKDTIPETLVAMKNSFKQNKEGKYMNYIITYHENNILEKAEKKSSFKKDIDGLIFDGFHLRQNDKNKIEDILSELNNMMDDRINFISKPFDTSVVLDEGVELDCELTPTYEVQKKIFEENHFIIENPMLYGREYEIEGEKKYQFYSKEKFRELCRPIKYFDEKDKEFFPAWMEDSTRRHYKEISFLPTHKKNNEVYNSFEGFNFEPSDDFDKENPNETYHDTIKIYAEHLKRLTNYHEESFVWLHNYICHLIQKPEQKPRVAVILKSKQGFGKDSLIDIIDKMITKKYTKRTADMEDVFGSYNVGIRDKLVLVLNETEGKDGYEKKEKIKNLITENDTIIREKYVSQYEQVNYLRLFILSNNINPIEISYDDRRFCVFKSHHKKPSKKYFTTLHDHFIEDDEQMEILFNYLYNYDISGFKPHENRPKTDAYNSMREHNMNPIYSFLKECFLDENWKDYFNKSDVKKHKKTGTYYVDNESFFQTYKMYLDSENKGYIKPSFKMIKSILGDIGITKQKKQIGKERHHYYVIDPVELAEQLEDMQLDEEVEEFDEDEFECESDDEDDSDDNF